MSAGGWLVGLNVEDEPDAVEQGEIHNVGYGQGGEPLKPSRESRPPHTQERPPGVLDVPTVSIFPVRGDVATVPHSEVAYTIVREGGGGSLPETETGDVDHDALGFSSAPVTVEIDEDAGGDGDA